MAGSRPNIFGDEDDLNLDQFKPGTETPKPSVPAAAIRKLSEEGGFPSRSPTVDKLTTVARRTAKTGRTVLLNARVTQRAHDRFHELVDAEYVRFQAGEIMHKPTLGEIVERALAAYERERAGQRPSSSGTLEK
jgi:hypothetical protein